MIKIPEMQVFSKKVNIHRKDGEAQRYDSTIARKHDGEMERGLHGLGDTDYTNLHELFVHRPCPAEQSADGLTQMDRL